MSCQLLHALWQGHSRAQRPDGTVCLVEEGVRLPRHTCTIHHFVTLGSSAMQTTVDPMTIAVI
jgi:hypothetical protein